MRKLPLTIIVFGLMATASAAAPGDPRINVDGMSCREVRNVVARTGAAILRYSSRQSDRILYDRFVADDHFCQPGELAIGETVFRREGKCRLLTCQIPERDNCRLGDMFCRY
ncbi:hypothetical protein [Notoacmeibacter ruber]|uniref:Uncharacterized protein n=1 Tax=Notoacmeibacter ruber TaxID=2670375 RepID=A0A3L7JC39_9HYPH|nr:hypothetical protein [Notoacmeibacter ruber]RLQ88297.1 hypothetical protein D8780_08855 [Notoacmeibacter ruber]